MDVDILAGVARTWPAALLALFRKLQQNVVDQPDEAKFRRLNLKNAKLAPLFAAPYPGGGGSHSA